MMSPMPVEAEEYRLLDAPHGAGSAKFRESQKSPVSASRKESQKLTLSVNKASSVGEAGDKVDPDVASTIATHKAASRRVRNDSLQDSSVSIERRGRLR